MNYTVIQRLETLGVECPQTFDNKNEAERFADYVRESVMNDVSRMSIQDKICGDLFEQSIWRDALSMVPANARFYNLKAALYVASFAVVIEEDL